MLGIKKASSTMAGPSKAVFFFLMLVLAACSAQDDHAAGGDQFTNGVDYQILARPVATDDPSKIELAEVFWYGCIHCYRFEPLLEEFATELPEDVNVVRVPVVWNATAELHAKIFYASEALGINEDIHMDVFRALNDQRKILASESAVLNFIEDLGHNRIAFQRAFNSFGVNSQVALAKSKATAYGVRGTPELVVNGKYRISSAQTGTADQMLVVAAELIERERAAQQ